tara:strand:- start:673 stop:855 length:183 start_codon:yes stop_codon:yes gene_type:complete
MRRNASEIVISLGALIDGTVASVITRRGAVGAAPLSGRTVCSSVFVFRLWLGREKNRRVV